MPDDYDVIDPPPDPPVEHGHDLDKESLSKKAPQNDPEGADEAEES